MEEREYVIGRIRLLPKKGLREVADFIEFLEKKRREMEKREGKKGESDPLSDVIGICEGPSDLAERHDKYLYG
jgi:hypothetical protein